MASGDWIALGAAIVATVALAVAVITYRLQMRTQATSDEQQLNDLIEKIQGGLADLDKISSAITMESFTASGVTLTSLRGQALEARKLIKRAGIEPDWFQNMILGYAFTQAWDPKAAFTYWDDAVSSTVGGGTHQAHVSSLEARAKFYYSRGLLDDWDKARADFDTARAELLEDPERQGRDLAMEQVALMSLRQAAVELTAEGETAAAARAAEAFLAANSIGAQWRKRHALKVIGNLVLELQQKEEVPGLLGKVAAELARRGGGVSDFPDATAQLLSLPPDGSLSLAPDADTSLPPDGGVPLAPDGGVALPPDGGVPLPPDGGVPLLPDGGVPLPPDGTLIASADQPARRDGEE
jgi:hypothetical protein